MTPLPALLARLSEATEGSRELDSAIGYYFSHADYRWWCDRAGPNDFTRSIDAALTLVPEGYHYTIGNIDDQYLGQVYPPYKTRDHMKYQCAYSLAPALALCIAALKARSTP